MAMFQIPQFIDQKPKIVGSLNLLQFGYIAVAGLAIFGLYYVFTLVVWVLVSLPIAGVAAVLSFMKINGQDAHKVVGSLFRYLLGSKIYVWKRENPSQIISTEGKDVSEKRAVMGLQEKIKSITTMLTTSGKKIQPGTTEKSSHTEEGKELVTFETGEKKLVKRVDY